LLEIALIELIKTICATASKSLHILSYIASVPVPRMDAEVLVLKDVTIPDGRVTDITIQQGIVRHVGSSRPADHEISCSNLIVIPAAVDLHVHMRGGSHQGEKEDWNTGTKSALAGGVTVVVDQPNTIPPLTNVQSYNNRHCEAENHSWCNFAINAGVTEKSDISGLWNAGAMIFGETFAGPSSYGEALSPASLTKALQDISACGGMASIHAEMVSDGTDTNLLTHHTLRSPQGEAAAIRMVTACNTSKCQLYFCHVSSGAAMDAVRDAFIEVTPHHLFLSLQYPDASDTRFRVNPPVRPEQERKNLWNRWNRIDTIASDHAPHTKKEKNLDFIEAPSGIPGLETMIPLLMAEVQAKRISLLDLIEKTSITPSSLLGLPPAGYAPGNRADFALYPHTCSAIDPDMLQSKAGWTPYEGMNAIFPNMVIMNGEIVYNNGTFYRGHPHWIPGRGYIPAAQNG